MLDADRRGRHPGHLRVSLHSAFALADTGHCVILARYLRRIHGGAANPRNFLEGAIAGHEIPARPAAYRLLPIVLVALVLRLVVMYFVFSPEVLNPGRHHWYFAGEVGQIAGSLVEGKGFGNPFFASTGPTAWLVPIYPSLLGAVFFVFGEYTKAAAIGILSLNCLFSALTCLPVFFMARRSFGEPTAFRAAWVWAFFPYSINFAVGFIWATTLTTLLLPAAFLSGLRLEESARPRAWIWFGLLSGIAAMTDPVVMTTLPALGLWMGYRAWRQRRNWFRLGLAATFAFLAVVAPWFMRNYLVFHEFVPFRDNFGLELCLGNNSDTLHWAALQLGPAHNEQEWQRYVRMGELPYLKSKKQQAMAFIATHKAQFAWTSVRRAIYMWTNYWSFNTDYLKEEPFDIPAIFLNTALNSVGLWGLWIGWRKLGAAVVPYAIVVFGFPVVYYLTHPGDYLRRPADPFFVVLAVYAVTMWLQRRKAERGTGA